MRVLLDENLPRRLAGELIGHEAKTVPEMGWASLKNGALLAAAAKAGFGALLTMDRNIPGQQKLDALPFGVVIVRAHDNRLGTLLGFVPEMIQAIEAVRPGQVLLIGEG